MKDETLVLYGGEIKALGDGKIGGYLVRFTDAATPDLTGDYFSSLTDFDAKTGDKVTIYYNHGYDPVLKTRKLGKGTIDIQDVGVWVEAQLQLRDEYEQAIYNMALQGKLGWSSGTLGYLVEREPKSNSVYWIKSWPLGKDASLTPTPAAGPQLTQAVTMKSWVESLTSQQADGQKTVGDTVTHAATAKDEETIINTSTAKRLTLELELLKL